MFNYYDYLPHMIPPKQAVTAVVKPLNKAVSIVLILLIVWIRTNTRSEPTGPEQPPAV